ncbi:MAG: hypothetical protein IT210_10180 [Armatimonadetes bacterium]|nr:hypothetical protein [Armatimonadota bacterium]
MTALLRRDAPSVKIIAWVYAGNRAGHGEVNLANTAVRKAMVREAVWLVSACGFDEIQ